MSVNGEENIECWSLMTFICDQSAGLKTKQPEIIFNLKFDVIRFMSYGVIAEKPRVGQLG